MNEGGPVIFTSHLIELLVRMIAEHGDHPVAIGQWEGSTEELTQIRSVNEVFLAKDGEPATEKRSASGQAVRPTETLIVIDVGYDQSKEN